MAATSSRDSSAMKTLTFITTLFLPGTFVAVSALFYFSPRTIYTDRSRQSSAQASSTGNPRPLPLHHGFSPPISTSTGPSQFPSRSWSLFRGAFGGHTRRNIWMWMYYWRLRILRMLLSLTGEMRASRRAVKRGRRRRETELDGLEEKEKDGEQGGC